MAKGVLTVIGTGVLASAIGFGMTLLFVFINQLTLGSEDSFFWALLGSLLGLPEVLVITLAGWLIFIVLVTLMATMLAVETFPYSSGVSEREGYVLPAILAGVGTVTGVAILPIGLADAAPDVIAWLTADAITDLAFNLGSLLVAGVLSGCGALIGRAITGAVLGRRSPVPTPPASAN